MLALHNLISALLVNVFWISLVPIGFALLMFFGENSKRFGAAGRFALFALRQQIVFRLLLAAAVAFAVFGVVAILCYLTHAPVVMFAVFYVMLLGASLVYMAIRLWRILRAKTEFTFSLAFPLRGPMLFYLTLATVLTAVGAVLFDFAVGNYIGAEVLDGSDAYVHIAKIMTMLHQGFSLDDGFFSTIVESRYHYNVVHALYALGSYVTGLPPAEVWRYSLGFFRVLVWASLFSFAYHICVYWLKNKTHALLVASLAVIVALARFSGYFFVANYPNEIVVPWLVLLVVGMSLYEAGRSGAFLMLMAAFLAMMTHPTYALMAAGFVTLTLVVKAVLQRREFLQDKKSLIMYLSVLGLLVLSPLVSFVFPDRMTEESFSFGPFTTTDIAGYPILTPYVPRLFTEIAILAVCSLGFIGLVYLMRRTAKQLSIILALIIFFPIIAYNPLAFGIISDHLPLWLIDRFKAMNLLVYIALPLGAYMLAHILGWFGKNYFRQPERRMQNLKYLFMLALCCIFALNWIGTTYRNYTKHREPSKHYYAFLERTSNSFGHILKDNKVVVASLGDSYFLPSAVSIDVVAIYDAHATPVADSGSRRECLDHLMKSFDYSSLHAVKADYIVIAKYESDFSKTYTKLKSLPYLSKTAENSDFTVFVVDRGQEPAYPANKSCEHYQQSER